jgi:tripartite-type tricarboxylate transporter receptor subunit TctC
MPDPLRRLTLLLMASAALPARAANDATIHLVVPFAAGSAPDTIGRLLADGLGPALDATVVVDNVPGAGGRIGVQRVTQAAPDGHTLVLSGDGALVIDAGTAPPELAPISQLVLTPNVLVVSNTLPVHSVAELLTLVRSQPGRFSYASAGNGTSSHRAGELLNRLAGLDLVHVPYTASPLPDVMAGHVPIFFANIANAMPLVRDGKLRALAVSSASRSAAAPELPTMTEAGLPGFEAVAWFGLLAPAGTPPSTVQRLQAAAQQVLAQPALRSRLQALGTTPLGSSAAEFTQLIERERRRWAALASR